MNIIPDCTLISQELHLIYSRHSVNELTGIFTQVLTRCIELQDIYHLLLINGYFC